MQSKLIVIEGNDGTGKTTQLTLLSEYLKSKNIPHQVLDFPQYDKTFFGRWIGRFLKGDFGKVEEIPSYLLAFPYAADRFQAKEQIKNWLNDGNIVLTNRYAPSNAVYQGAKLPEGEQKAFINWCYEMEYDVFGIPREDLVIYLSLPVDVSQKLIEEKSPRNYLDGQKKDIHEENVSLLGKVNQLYEKLSSQEKHWVKIDSSENGEILSKEKIHEKIISVLKDKKILS